MNRLLFILGAPAVLFWRLLQSLRRQRVDRREVWVQLSELGSASSLLVTTGLAFFGVVMVTIAWAQARKYTGNITVVGPAYFQLVLREFAPLLAGVLVASRAGAATSAELAAMSVNEQVEALELSAADPLVELVAPRFLASLLAVPALTVLGTVASTLSAALWVTLAFRADGRAFLSAQYVEFPNLLSAGLKAVLAGAYIPLAAAARGLRARGGAAAVGEAVTLGVVDATLGCLLIDFFIAAVFVLFRG